MLHIDEKGPSHKSYTLLANFTQVGTSKKSAGRLAWHAEKSCQLICADSRHPFVLHPVLSAVSVPFRDLQQQIGQ